MTRIALLGNPNSGKSSLFNRLTGMQQHVGNYPGVTVDKHEGTFMGPDNQKITVIDLPGTYSLFPKSADERVATDVLTNSQHPDHPQLAVVVADATNLQRSLLLFTQTHDMGIPTLLALTMNDQLAIEGITIDDDKLSELFGQVPVVRLNTKKGHGIPELKKAIVNFKQPPHEPFLANSPIQPGQLPANLPEPQVIADTEARFKKIGQMLSFCLSKKPANRSRKLLSQKIDRIVTHPVLGYGIFLFILFLIFQAIYAFANIPMDLIDNGFAALSQWLGQALPAGTLTDLLTEGIVPGIGGVVIFIPQIVLLFAFIGLLEESGYMTRVVFIMDRLMRPFGLNGKSVVPLMSGVACAIPAIMASRAIDQWKDRLVTIMVVPLTSCSARLPVYALLIALVVPNQLVWGVVNLQGLALLAMYLLGFGAAFLAAIVFKWLVKAKQKSFLVMELPTYQLPRASNLGLLLLEKTRVFVVDAGKIILALSIILWVLASYGPPGKMDEAVAQLQASNPTAEQVAAVRLENSFIGIMGKTIEPAIAPLGYDWQMGIALIASFAAREVFVSAMATIYSVGDDSEVESTLMERMRQEVNPKTGLPVYTLASGFSLMVFYAFAMQCMSTLAVVKRETKSWKWPMVQMAYMTTLAYVAALITYIILK